MILLINICKEHLHYFEFVKPIEDILIENRVIFLTRSYRDMKEEDLEKADKVIICGTSLKDNEFSKKENLKYFHWIKEMDIPILGICGGMQAIGLTFGGKIKEKTEMGFYRERFVKNFLGLEGEQEVYHLHNHYVDFSCLMDFEVFSFSEDVSQAVKHVDKEIYGVLFHPEVRQKALIKNFSSL